MSRHSTRFWIVRFPSLSVKWLAVAGLAGMILGAGAAPAQAAWALPHPRPPTVVRPPDQSWMMDVPQRPGARSKGKIAVFVFKGDDIYEPVRAAVVRALRAKGLNVTATLKPVDSAAQYREMSYALNLAVFVEGELTGEGAHQSAHIRLRSGMTGQPVASATFAGLTPKIVGDVARGLWGRVGPVVRRACSNAARPRRREREPLHIEAGTPMENTTISSEGT
jgi:hypothetical protein